MKQHFILLILTLVTIPFLFPFFKGTYFESDDGLWAVVRQASLHNELRTGQFPVRWSGSLNYGYGYPLFNFSYPGPYYIGEVFKVIGFDFIWSVKLTFILATIVSVTGMYFCARELWKSDLAGVIAALFYLAGPYRWVNTYIRGSLGEIVAFAIFPFLCYVGVKLLATGKRRYLLSGSLLLALLIISHNIMALLFMPFFIMFIIGEIFLRYVKFNVLLKNYIEEFQNRNKGFKDNYDRKLFLNHIHLVVVMIILSIGLSAFFWLPALSELHVTKLAETPLTNITQEFSKVKGLFVTPFDNRSTPDDALRTNFVRDMYFVHLTVIITVVLILFFYRKDYQVRRHRIILYMIGYLVAAFFLTPFSEILWKNIPGLKVVDFPWRIYGILMFARPLMVAGLALIPKLRYVGLALSIIPLFSGLSGIGEIKYTDIPSKAYETNQATTTSANEYINKWVKKPFTSHQTEAIIEVNIPEGNTFTASATQTKSTHKKATYTSLLDTEVQLPIMYFPGWKVLVDGKKHDYSYQDNNGIIKAKIPAGTHTIEAVFEETVMRTVGNGITLTTILIITIGLGIQYNLGKRFVL